MLRWLTAGESHGPALVAILEGLPAHVQVTSADIAEALARRRLGFGRGARMKFEAGRGDDLLGGVRHGETLGGPVAIQVGNTEWPKWETVMAADPVDDGGARRPGPQRPADPAATRPRRPGRHAEVRLRRGPADPGAGQRPGDGRPGRARRGRQRLPAAGVRRHACSATSSSSAPSPARRGLLPDPRRPARHRRRPAALLRPRRQRGAWSPRSRRPRRTATPSAAWSRCWPAGCRRDSGRTCTGTAGSTPGWPAALMGIQAIKGVEVGDGFDPGPDPRHRRPTTRSSPTPTADRPASPTGPAAPRAA